MAERDEMVLALAGNIYIEHPVSVYRNEGFLNLVALMRSTDAAVANMECAIVDGNEWPSFGSGMGWAGSYLGAPPSMVDEIKALGFGAICAANNHVADFGENGILSTMKHLRHGGIPFAGIGASLAEASEPCYISTAHGRVALISAADWGPRQSMDLPGQWPMGYMPSDDGPHYVSRPGVNLLRYDAALHVDQQAWDELRRISTAFDWERTKAARRAGGGQHSQPLIGPTMIGWEQDTDTDFFFMGRKFVRGGNFTHSTYPFQEDLDRLTKSIRDARRSADVVVVALHDQIHGENVPDYVSITAHASVDAGADVFLCNGGITRGIEVYGGKAIIHGTTGFCLQNTGVTHVPPSVMRRKGLPPDATAADLVHDRAESHVRAERAGGVGAHMPAGSDALVHTVVFDAHCEVKEVRVHPIERMKGTRHGTPWLVEPDSEIFKRVMQKTTDQCNRLDTEFQVRDRHGAVTL
jgi:poly-gamma-glutamate synthesis protein (capsule biosynthesis protein)